MKDESGLDDKDRQIIDLKERIEELLAKIGELELMLQSNILDNPGLGESDYQD